MQTADNLLSFYAKISCVLEDMRRDGNYAQIDHVINDHLEGILSCMDTVCFMEENGLPGTLQSEQGGVLVTHWLHAHELPFVRKALQQHLALWEGFLADYDAVLKDLMQNITIQRLNHGTSFEVAEEGYTLEKGNLVLTDRLYMRTHPYQLRCVEGNVIYESTGVFKQDQIRGSLARSLDGLENVTLVDYHANLDTLLGAAIQRLRSDSYARVLYVQQPL
ncbi:MAG: hypothetical protein ACQESG_06585 [Nanobdellota archaeon]